MAPFRYAAALTLVLSLTAAVILPRDAHAVPTVWSGLTKTFTKSSFSDYTLPQNQDELTENVVLTRGDFGGLINYAGESSFFALTSPVDTEWATDLTTDQTIAASNWQSLVAADAFTNWIAAYGGQHTGGSMIAGRNAVVHLISDDVYLDVRFTSWAAGGGGGYSYMRAEPSTPVSPTGDYNGNGAVDAADYAIWRRTLNQSASPAGSAADGDSSGTIDQGDYTYWRERYGNAPVGLGAGLTSVPEPMTVSVALQLIAGLLCAFRRRRSTAVGTNSSTNFQDQSRSIHLAVPEPAGGLPTVRPEKPDWYATAGITIGATERDEFCAESRERLPCVALNLCPS